MKKIILTFMTLCIVVFGSFNFVGCEDDDDGGDYPKHPPQLSGDEEQGQDGNQTTMPDEEVQTDEELAKAWEDYLNMDGAQQKAFWGTFNSTSDFTEWSKKAKDAYERVQNRVLVDGENQTEDIGKQDND